MKLTPDNPSSQYLISSCDEQQVEISGKTYQGNIIIGKETLVVDELGQSPDVTSEQQWQALWQLQPEIVLVGTRLPLTQLATTLQPLFYSRKIGLEIMPASAACRTLTVLLAEERHAFAALFF